MGGVPGRDVGGGGATRSLTDVEPEVFGPYRLDTLIGRGGMGEVHRAYDTRRERFVALKRLLRELAADEQYRSRFQRESALAAKLNDPHIVPIHDYGEIDGQLFIDMPLVDGTDLDGLVDREGPLAPARAVGIVDQVADALDVAHGAGLVHRDVKPSNTLITHPRADRDFVYLIDFGIARAVGSTSISQTGSVIGTPAYMAPERFEGDGDHRGDVYALACMLYAALTGRPPFEPPGPGRLSPARLRQDRGRLRRQAGRRGDQAHALLGQPQRGVLEGGLAQGQLQPRSAAPGSQRVRSRARHGARRGRESRHHTRIT